MRLGVLVPHTCFEIQTRNSFGHQDSATVNLPGCNQGTGIVPGSCGTGVLIPLNQGIPPLESYARGTYTAEMPTNQTCYGVAVNFARGDYIKHR